MATSDANMKNAMKTKTRTSKRADQALLTEARARYAKCVLDERENREEALKDAKFRAGDQWDDDIKVQRKADGRPCFTINRLPQFIRQITGDMRLNKPAIKVVADDGNTDPYLARIMAGLIRNIESRSRARMAYIKGADNAVTGGLGFIRVLTEYTDDEVFEQDIRIKAVSNPFSIYYDPAAVEHSRQDAKFWFVTEMVDRAEFEAEYPGKSVKDFAENEGEYGDWYGGDKVRKAEYWRRVKDGTKVIAQLADGSVIDTTVTPGWQALQVVNTRTVPRWNIEQYVISGAEVLEGPNLWAGKYFPFVPVLGEEVHIGDKVVRHGIVRGARDPQKLFNIWRSAGAELVALAPKTPFIIAADQLQGYEKYWNQANNKNYPYLPYKAQPGAPVPQRQAPPQHSQGILQEGALAADDMKSTMGIHDAALGARSNETSGVAITARQHESDVSTFVYIDNLNSAIEHVGAILVDLIPRIYDTPRMIRILGDDGKEEFANLLGPNFDADAGTVKMLDLARGKYDVNIETGPNFSTRRAEVAATMMNFARAVPAAGAVIGDLIAKNQDWPGADEIAKRLQRILPPELRDGDVSPPPPPSNPLAALTVATKQAGLEGKKLDNAKKQMDVVKKQMELAEQRRTLSSPQR